MEKYIYTHSELDIAITNALNWNKDFNYLSFILDNIFDKKMFLMLNCKSDEELVKFSIRELEKENFYIEMDTIPF